jgi:uncharacterized protein (TIGR00645 family)
MDRAESDSRLRPRGLERGLGRAIFGARWLVAPLYFGLLFTLVLLLVKFVQKLIEIITGFVDIDSSHAILIVLRMIDLVLVANLVVMVMFAGWENFVAPIFAKGEGRLEWLGTLDFSGLKLKLIASIAAIASVQLLEDFMDIETVPQPDVLWQLAILVGLAATGVLLALMDRLSGAGH